MFVGGSGLVEGWWLDGCVGLGRGGGIGGVAVRRETRKVLNAKAPRVVDKSLCRLLPAMARKLVGREFCQQPSLLRIMPY